MRPRLYVLLGPSGVGKSSVKRYLEEHVGAESAPKYTTRPSRGTPEDAQDFVFCGATDMFPSADLLVFESYGHAFGIQLEAIRRSMAAGRSHVVVVGSEETAERLREEFGAAVVVALVYCDRDVLQSRLVGDKSVSRLHRWPSIERELGQIYRQLGAVDCVINNSGTEIETRLRIDQVLLKL